MPDGKYCMDFSSSSAMKINLNLKPEYRANVIAQFLGLILNCALYVDTDQTFFLWANIACVMFIAFVKSQPRNSFFDLNLFNHLSIVLIYYLLYLVSMHFRLTYFCLIFLFTYFFYIMKDSGFGQSVNLWTYIQSLMVATSFTRFPFHYKILATLWAYAEAQILLYVCFKLFPSGNQYIREKFIFQLKHLRQVTWFNLYNPTVWLAIRGALTAAILYIVCVSFVFNDSKPNWAVIVAVSCLMRNDDAGSKRSMISCTIGSILGTIISLIIIRYLPAHSEISVAISWISIILGLIFIFEYNILKTYPPQIMSVTLFIVALVTLSIIPDFNSNQYLHLRIINNFIGLIGTAISLLIWIFTKKLLKLR